MRRIFAVGCLAVLALAQPVAAQTVVDQVVSQLRQQGYSGVSVEDTLLGRARITAERRGGKREIVVNPRTGEILRDIVLVAGGATSGAILSDDDDDDDDADDSDNDSDSDSDGGKGRGRGGDDSGGDSGGSGRGGDSGGDDD